MFQATLRQIVTCAALAAGIAATSPALADIAASVSTSGSPASFTLMAQVSPEGHYIGRGKLYVVVLHGSQLYVMSETQGLLPYTGGEALGYRTILQTTENIAVENWNTTALAGASVFVGFGMDTMDMINNGKFKLVATLPRASTPAPAPAPTPTPAPTPAPAPSAGSSYASHNGSYLCYDSYGRSGTVSGTFTSSRAVIDTSRLSNIPDYTFSLPISTLVYQPGVATYNNLSFPLRVAALDLTRSSIATLVLVYQSSQYSSEVVYACGKL